MKPFFARDRMREWDWGIIALCLGDESGDTLGPGILNGANATVAFLETDWSE